MGHYGCRVTTGVLSECDCAYIGMDNRGQRFNSRTISLESAPCWYGDAVYEIIVPVEEEDVASGGY